MEETFVSGHHSVRSPGLNRPLSVYLFLIALLIVLTIPSMAFSISLAGGVHDRSNDPAFLASSSGICVECHVPHYSFEIRLWGRDLVGTADVDDLCVDCHDGAAPAWASSAQNVSKVQLSYHDFSDNTAIAPRGACSACHDLHLPNDSTASYVGTFFTSADLWTRDLAGEFSEFDVKRNLSNTTPPNYLIGATVQCYDCHAGNPADNGPGYNDFNPDPLPQDIAFGGDGSDGDSRGTALGDGEKPGYYELTDGSEPDNLSAPTVAEVKGGEVPGGHFVKSKMGTAGSEENYSVRDPDGNLLYRISIGDKLPCHLCHDPHAGYDSSGDAGLGDDEVFFRRQVYAGMGTIVEQTDNFFDDLRASSQSRHGTGNGRAMCIYCHGTADWDGNATPSTGYAPLLTDPGSVKRAVYGIKTMVGNADTVNASRAFPPPLGPPEHESTDTTSPCTTCHDHNNTNAACGGCHDFPPTTGAHTAHASTLNGKPAFNCETCHGPNPGSASWHNESSASSYSATNSTHFNNITLKPDLSAVQMGASEYAYYNSTWTRSSPAFAPTVTKAAGYQFVCTNVYCHGMDPVNWTWQPYSTSNPAPEGGYEACGGCHGMTTDIDGDGDVDPDRGSTGVIDVASFWDRSGNLYEASNAAANYEVPVSCFSRGGHGDTNINNESPFIDSAPSSSLPVACGTCHNGNAVHFDIAGQNPSNPYRLKQPGTDFTDHAETDGVTDLCTQSNCHPREGTLPTDYRVLQPGKHPNDFWPLNQAGEHAIVFSDTSKPLLLTGNGSTSDPRYDPSTKTSPSRTIGIHIDGFADHWAWWGGTSVTTSTADDYMYLPLGDSLTRTSTGDYDNNDTPAQRITCITCHNPHGTDLLVATQSPGCGSTYLNIPDNNMLRIRYIDPGDDELCQACH
jgi:predicted CXXCH cytochrome family protein